MGFEPTPAEWKVQTIPRSYDSRPSMEMYFDAAVWVTNIIESWYQTLASIYYSNSSKHTAQWSARVFTCPGFDDADWPLSTNNDLFCDVELLA